MKIQNSAVFQEMQSMALEAGRNNQIERLPVKTQASSTAQFGDMLSDAINTCLLYTSPSPRDRG